MTIESYTFTTLGNVIKKFLSGCERKIYIGNSAVILPDIDNDISFNRRLSQIDLDDTYQSREKYEILFVNDLVYRFKKVLPEILYCDLQGFVPGVQEGISIADNFISDDKLIGIKSSYWSGNMAKSGDVIHIDLNTDISISTF